MIRRIILFIIIFSLVFSVFVYKQTPAKAATLIGIESVIAKETAFGAIKAAGAIATGAALDTGALSAPAFVSIWSWGNFYEKTIQHNVKEPTDATTGAAERIFDKFKIFLLALFKRFILDRMVDQIVQWIQGGGEPQFVQDWGTFLNDASNLGQEAFIKDYLDADYLCSPFSLTLRNQKMWSRPLNPAQCTFETVFTNLGKSSVKMEDF